VRPAALSRVEYFHLLDRAARCPIVRWCRWARNDMGAADEDQGRANKATRDIQQAHMAFTCVASSDKETYWAILATTRTSVKSATEGVTLIR